MDKMLGAACAVSFTLGVLAGGIFTSKKLEAAYQNRLREDLDNAREARRKFLRISKEKEKKQETKEPEFDIPEKPQEQELKKKVKEFRYDNSKEHPYIISPDEFGEFEDYETITLKYYDDAVLADENYQTIDDYYETFDIDICEHFGEYEEDSVYLRDDARKCDYEILRVLENYSDILMKKPYLRNSE